MARQWVHTTRYEAAHGHKPRQARGTTTTSLWAFALDGDLEHPVVIRGTFKDAVTQAKQQARYVVTVLP